MKNKLCMSTCTHIHIQSLEWYDHPESCKYVQFEINPSSAAMTTTSALTKPAPSTTLSIAPQDSHSVKHILSPRSPGATPTTPGSSQKRLAHINSLGKQEVEYALKDFEVTNQVSSSVYL